MKSLDPWPLLTWENDHVVVARLVKASPIEAPKSKWLIVAATGV
jgi:hypothetical protein